MYTPDEALSLVPVLGLVVCFALGYIGGRLR